MDAQEIVPESYPSVVEALWQPERRLMLAVLEDAIDAYLANAGAEVGIRRARFKEAASWLRSNDTSWPFSFVRICDALGIDPAVIRRMLRRRTAGVAVAVRPVGSEWSRLARLPSLEQLAPVASAG